MLKICIEKVKIQRFKAYFITEQKKISTFASKK